MGNKNYNEVHWLYKGLAIMFVLVGIAIAISIIQGTAFPYFTFNRVWNLL